MRRYFFNNFYVAGIRTGIQAGHASEENWARLVSLLLKGKITKAQRKLLEFMVQFALEHKTWIVLNGGDHDALTSLVAHMSDKKNPYPWDLFKEPGLNNTVTSVTIVLPERMYDDLSSMVGRAAQKVQGSRVHHWLTQVPPNSITEIEQRKYTPWEVEFLRRKAACGLAS